MKVILFLFYLIILSGSISAQVSPETVAQLTLLNPNGYETISQGKQYPVSWSFTGKFNSFNIDISKDGGINWTNIVEDLPGDQYQYEWKTWKILSGNCRIRISGISSQQEIIQDNSDFDFTIVWPNLFFDDFSYTDNSDSKIKKRGWEIVDRNTSPPCRESAYRKEMVSFEKDLDLPDNKLLVLSTYVNTDVGSIKFSRLETNKHTMKIFNEGIYTARVMFDNKPAYYKDGNIETFYAINNRKCNDRKHSECDFEYLPYDFWDNNGSKSASLHLTSWEAYGCNGTESDRSATDLTLFSDGWELLKFEVLDGENVKYFSGNKLLETHRNSNQAHSVYPDSDMQIAFANWIWAKNSCEYQIGDSHDTRVAEFKIDFVLFLQKEFENNDDNEINATKIESIVKRLRDAGITYANTLRGNSFISFNEDKKTELSNDVINFNQ
jgi:hypothetical protein